MVMVITSEVYKLQMPFGILSTSLLVLGIEVECSYYNQTLEQQEGLYPRPGLQPHTPDLGLLRQPCTSNVLTVLLHLPSRPIGMDFVDNIQVN